MPRLALLLMLFGLLAACVEPVVPPPTVPDDDDATGDDDDDDSSVGDDDDTTPGDDDDDDDDDDTTDPPSTTVTIEADAPTGAVVLSQDGAGPWTTVTVTDLQGTFEVSDPSGHYGVILACEGAVGRTLRVHLSDATSEPSVVLACPEYIVRDGAIGALSGTVVGAEGAWRLFVGSRTWEAPQTWMDSYGIWPLVDNYDLIAQRIDTGNGQVNKQMISRVLDAGANPGFSIDFWNDGSGLPHTPETYELDVLVPATNVATRAVWLSRGGTVMPLGFDEGVQPSFFVISNERRFDREVVLSDTTSTYSDGCAARTMAVVDSDLMLDNAVSARHSSTLMPLEPIAESVCASALAPTIDVSSGLSVTWSTALSGSAPSDGVRVELTDPAGRPRWFVTATGSRLDHDVDVTDVLSQVGAAYGTPAAGWSWKSSAWTLPGVDVPASVPFLVMDTSMFEALPLGRSRFRFVRPGDTEEEEERNHEYEEDDETRPVIVLPWDMDNWAIKAITRSGSL